jgi:hypothetical protein
MPGYLSEDRVIHNGKASPKFIFDSRLTSYNQLSALNAGSVKFITLRRRAKKLVQDIAKIPARRPTEAKAQSRCRQLTFLIGRMVRWGRVWERS